MNDSAPQTESRTDVDSMKSSAEPQAATHSRPIPEYSTPNIAHQPEHAETLSNRHLRSLRQRLRLPLALFLITCLTTFWAGTTSWRPYMFNVSDFGPPLILTGGAQGTLYMACVLAILLAHEMGHFVATVIHRVPASLPFFIPFPLSPFGTLGAVIAMDGRRANRREIFDIGIAGPLAGLVLAVPILAVGVSRLNLSTNFPNQEMYDCPLLVEWMIQSIHPAAGHVEAIGWNQLNAFFMAGWVGLLITGLNMLPVSQLDGGHVIYALFGRRAHWISRGFIFVAIVYSVIVEAGMIWWPMIILVILMGTDHPPTYDDSARLGRLRIVLGYTSLVIPILCFPARGISLQF